MSEPRVAFVTAGPDGLLCGDPTGDHVVLTPTGLEYRRRPGTDGAGAEFDWATIRSLEDDATASPARRPGRFAVLRSAVAESIGLQWEPTLASFTLTVEDDTDRLPLACDGYIGGGYWSGQLRAVREALELWRTEPDTRAALARPEWTLGELAAAAEGPDADVRDALRAAWAD